MSQYNTYDYDWEERHQAYLERQARREARHQAYLERQRFREERHQAYLERQTRREANKAAFYERVSNNVLRFKSQYFSILDNLRQQGLDSYVQEEYGDIIQKLSRLDILLSADEVEAARDLSLEVGQTIHGLIPQARRIKQNSQMRIERAENERRENEIRMQARQDFIEQMRRNLENDKDSNPKAIQEAVEKLDDVKKNSEEMSNADFQEKLVAASDKVDGEIADETVRREVIKAIYQSLHKAGFIVNVPQLSGEVVILKAQKPAGQQAAFSVKLDGGLAFKFDNYEGQKCKKDIKEVTALLDECYGVKLTNRKVLWANPDKIQKGSRNNPSDEQTQNNR